ncbi:hypothetical protein NDU88_002315 [Pleurodeles waltl]|uniref:Fibronectin type-III domain-containing protein n=1 Tax=Pleurodeles waltl TaxID=8319 RepID=A0AAV7VEJ5_PLEWA|nr:hypothetical protein NDU88_002315 [Pleurodeles waltl]
MGRASRGLTTVLQAVFTCALFLYEIDSGFSKIKIPPPSNLRDELVNLFVVNWTWDSPKNLTSNATCELIYESVLNSKKIRSTHKNRTAIPPNLNNDICFQVKAICANAGESDWVKRCSYFLKGYPETLVRDLKWTWDEGKPLECTWNYQKSTPPEPNYILYYMSKNENEIHECQEYIHKEGVVRGCKFISEFYSGDKINILITDSLLKLGRFYSFLEPITILRPGPPNITVTKPSIDRIHVKWNDTSWAFKDYEVQSKDSKSQKWTTYYITGKNNFMIDSARRDVMYTVRVKAKFTENFGGLLWSNWSAEAIAGEHRDDDWTVQNILLITIPLIAAIVTILLLVCVKRLKVLICPPIPDPSKIFRDIIGGPGEEFQQWIKNSPYIFHNKPAQEETCTVTLVEKASSEMPAC